MSSMFALLAGYRLVDEPLMRKCRQIRFPRSKRRRIRRKWAKDMRNCEFRPDPCVRVWGDGKVVFGHPATMAELRRKYEEWKEKAAETGNLKLEAGHV